MTPRERLAATPMVQIVPAARVGLSEGESAALGAVVFFATIGVAILASTASTTTAFLMGMGWMVVLWPTYQWAQSVERAPEADLNESFASVRQRRELYSRTHDLRDLATLPCRYGCSDPATCMYAHVDCRHCFDVRRKARGDAR